MKHIALCVLLMTIAVQAAPLPEIINPSFEDMGDAPDRARGWARWGDWFNRETDWSPVRSGASILAYHHFRVEKVDDSGVWQDLMDIRAGSRYSFTVWVNVDWSATGQNAETVELRMESTLLDRQVTVQSKSYAVRDLARGSEWSELSVAGTAAANNLRVLIVVYPAREGPRDGAVKFDDAQLSPANSH